MFLLVDCNNFFVSCERLFQPGLCGKPVVVLSSNDGCVIARSNEAKVLGIGMGVPFFKVKSLCEQQGVVVRSSNFGLYGDVSRRVMAVLREMWGQVEVYSVDEAFLDVSGVADVEGFARDLRDTLWRWVGMPVSIGIAKTKTLAKVAAKLAKETPYYQGVFFLSECAVETAVLDRLPVGDVWGIGRKLSRRLEDMGIRTALALREMDPTEARRLFSVMVERTVYELRRLSCLRVEDVSAGQKSRVYSRSFSERIETLESLEEVVSTFVSRLGEQLRRANQVVGGLVVFVRSSPFVSSFYRASMYQSVDPATSDTEVLIGAALKALRGCYKAGVLYQKAGILLSDLRSSVEVTDGLFEDPKLREKSRFLMSLVDRINDVHGKECLRFAVTGTDRHWVRKSEHRSPSFTTEWKELLLVS